jgi:hypothetical protein
MNDDSPSSPNRPPHPLAVALIERLRGRSGARVLEIGPGSGRNTRALTAAGMSVQAFGDGAAPGATAALATHALLHGTPESIARDLRTIAALLEPDAPFYATFGSVRDARFGNGERLGEHVFAPLDGDEAGVAHTFFTRSMLDTLLESDWHVESIDEVSVDDVAGSWAHLRDPLRGAVHWFALLRKRSGVRRG